MLWKPLVILAIVANTALITPSEGTDPDGPYPEESGRGNPHLKCINPHEIYQLCPNLCPPRECGINKSLIFCPRPPMPGSKDCKPGCICADGFLRNRAGICIAEDECQYDCAKNETLDPCYSGCPPRLCGVNIAAVSCLAINESDCKRGCRCRDGYLRNAEGHCVCDSDCPQCTGPNEMYDICPNPCPPQRCDVDPRVIRCAAPPQPGDPKCNPGCRCVDGYVRNDDGICVTRDQCPQNCKGEHEIYSQCPALVCRPLNCTQVGFPRACAISGPDPSRCPGKPGCICENEYARNSRGKCIPIKKCPSCGGDPNSVSGCGVNCGKHCSDRNKNQPVVCTEICKENSCDCRKGFLYDDNTGKCVLPEDCTPVCGKDEVYSACTNGDCEPQNCSQLGYPILCPRIDPEYCIKGCLCKQGYVRAANGTCIPKEKCPLCRGDPNAVSGCGQNCGRRCSNYNSTKPVICSDICELNGCDCREGFVLDDSTGKCIRPNQCVSCGGDFNAKPGCDKNCTKRCPGPKPSECKCYKDGCVCKDGFLYDPKAKKCVRPEQCTPPCGSNEVLSNCSNSGCGPWRCTDVGIPTGCVKMDQKYCIVDCVCKEGYVRDDKEVCIPVTDCPECGGDPNATAGCGINCGRLCSNYFVKNVSCITLCLDNACDCRKGFVLDENINKCVSPKDCTPVCGKNEVFSSCVNGGCQAENCSQIGEPVSCVKPAKCKPGCLCTEGYLRDAYGKCIPKNECPPKCTGANEIYDPCPPSCPPQTCESIGQKYFCPLMPTNKSPEDCHGACRCKPNYFRNKLGDCISANNCLKCTGPHEFFACGGACDNVCATLNEQNQTDCPIINIKCNEMCYCEEGYARDKNKTCIPIDKCPGKCCENERWEECPARLCSPLSCKDLGFEKPCVNADNSSCPGLPGCVCDYDFVRDENGKCIPKEECPSCGGDPNAVSGCGLNCGRLCSNYDKGPVPCPRICKPNSCDCKKDYVLDENIKKCVLPKYCTPICKEHEVYSECTNGGCQARNCSQLGKPVPCVKLDPKSCIKGCVCEDGYLRARNGTCVPVDKCDNCNKPHEHYDPCAPSCPPQTCESIGRIYDCPIVPAVCRGACRCDKGYFRNKIGECIRKRDCLKCKGPYEYFSCGSACDNVCSTLYKQNQTNCPIKNIKCNPMCYCEKGYARNKYNVCIPIDKCPKPRCGVNERLEQCPPGLCTPQKCSQLGFPYPCPDLPKGGCPEPPGCVCIKDYVRNSRGRCIPKKNCPSCGGDPNAESGCGGNCGRTCSTYNRTDIACTEICDINGCDCRKGFVYDDNLKKCVRPKDCTPTCKKNEVYDSCANGGCGKRNCSQLGQPDLCIDVIECIGDCVCKEGYLRAKNGTCVPINQCPIPPCGKNERFEFCPDSVCEPQTCLELGFPIKCPALTGDYSYPGQPACICDYGFVRDDSGICIPKNKCPSCGGDPNAESGCGINCGRLCSNYNKGPVPCPKICKINACDCKKDYVFDSNIKKCVRPKQCTPICGKDEVFSECINGGCQPKNCSQLGKPVPCVKIDPKYCIKGCLCKEGYLRESNGVCVPKEKCGKNCWEPNEVYDPCPPSCPPQTCESINKTYNCPLIIIDQKDCKPACRCKKDYFRNKIGQCISKANCLKCTGPNEYFSCGGACDNVCATLNEQNQTNCPIINIVCNNMCYCEKGYARDDKNICVPIDQCPPPKCGENERLEDCPDWLCTPQSCSQLGYPIACPGYQGDSTGNQTSCPGKPGCVCIDNYVRDDCGKCIPIDQCPSCGGDANATSGCGVNCGRLCSNYKKKNVICPLICELNGCDCRKGFVFDSNLDKCVLPKDCTPVCGLNEVYDICANGGCQKRNCSQVGEPMLCIDPIKCIGGCVCEEGFLRNKNGTCVPEDQCPLQCTKPHEVYDPCPRTCPPQTCAAIGIAYPCPHPPEGEEFCQPACRCEDGYYRNSVDECISEADCLKCTGPNEYYSCGPALENVCATLSTQNQTNCAIKNIRYNSNCYCNEGYARDDNDICIPIDQCEVSCNGDPNAIPGCGNYCGDRCSDYNKTVTVCPLFCLLNGCDCKQGYVYDDNLKKCVLPRDCTPVCGNDEVYNTCINGGCQKKKCTDLGRPNICVRPRECIDGCLCAEGFLRADNGTCVPIDKCPTPVCPENEVFDSCANGGCNRRKCSELTDPIICRDPIECIGDCVCVDGFLRNEDGVCVPESECNPQCNRPHQVFDPCPSTCPPQTCESLDRAYICPIESGQDPPCQPGCVCEEGYFTNMIGECISQENCLKCMGPHEYYSCGGACDNVCETLNEQNQTNCPIINVKCNEMCYCEEGYARNASNICIPIKDCPLKCTGPNEHYSCGPACDNVCATLSTQNQTNCPIKNKRCNSKCYCNEGYARDDNDICIPIDQCGVSCNGDPNAIPGCGNHCGNRCSDYNKNVTFCPLFCLQKGCNCKQGYVFDDDLEKCVLPIDCTPVCPNNEVFDRCANGGCNRRKCSELTGPIICRDPIECIGDCVCVDGFLRNEDGVCVPESECNPQCYGEHKVFNPCPKTCPPQTCESLNKVYICYPETGEPEPPCDPGCVCEEGYYENVIGQCLTKDECLTCTGPNEYYSCGGACDNVCETLNEQNQTNCPIINVKCNEMCYCEEGYARNASNICIPIKDCPPSRCGPDERFEESPCRVCEPLTCDEVGMEMQCPPVEDNDCDNTPACICKNGLVRNDDGVCIPICECPPVCPNNEVFDRCANGGCNRRKCSELTGPIICRDPIECIGDCVCVDGFLRNEDGVCVPASECNPQCYGEHKVFNPCPKTCPPQTCESLNKVYICYPETGEPEPPCEPGCVCKEGYYENVIGQCLTKEECLTCTGPNEYYSCGGACDNVCETLNEQNQTNCPIINVKCNEMCYCEEGYARNASNICIPIKDCPPSRCGPDERFEESPCRVCEPLTCDEVGMEMECPPVVDNDCDNTPACICKNGLVRNDDGVCIPTCECPPVCPNNEVFDRCANGGCNRRKCSELTGPIICRDPIECIGDCVCVDGFLRNEDGVCVPESECNPQCYGEHKIFNPCPKTCPPQTCESLNKVYICYPETGEPEPPCEPGCVCEEGYYENVIGQCLTKDECLTCTGPNEYYSCGGACDNVCETLNEQNQTNCPIINVKCNEMCYCEEGYARNASNICIPIKDCPPSRCGPDERFEESPSRVCEPLTCDEVGMEMECPPVEDNDCDDTPACICKNGLVRNDDGVCIPICECRE